MGIFDAWKARRRRAFVDRAEELGGSVQAEMAKFAMNHLGTRHEKELACSIAAAIANYVFRFGYVNPKHEADKGLFALCETERPNVLRALGDTFKTNATGVLILLGAAWAIDLAKFKGHMLLLAREGFAKVGREAPNVSRELPEADSIYMYEVVSMEPGA